MTRSKQRQHLSDYIWDLWCIGSIIGIWPRFIEPNILSTTKLSLPIQNLAAPLNGLKIVQFSDLHLHPKTSLSFLNRLIKKINRFQPDLIVFTGDLLCNSKMEDPEKLKKTLNRFESKYGCYAVPGNHDYNQPVSINDKGVYDIKEEKLSMINQGLKRLLSPLFPKGEVSSRAKKIPLHNDLLQILAETPFKMLNNSTETLVLNDAHLNITGLGDYMLGKCLPEKAFKNFQPNAPGIVLTHNPDSIPLLEKYPGNLILAGHTHGAQVNFPFFWNHFTLMEQPQYKRGLSPLYSEDDESPGLRRNKKWAYINRGVGSVMPFRWFSTPEITLITLKMS